MTDAVANPDRRVARRLRRLAAAVGCAVAVAVAVGVGRRTATVPPGPDDYRVYDIRDLIDVGQRWTDAVDPGWRTRVHGCFVTPQSMPDTPAQQCREEADAVVRLVEYAVSADSWQDNGGDVGTSRYLGGTLLVKQSAEGHRSLSVFLDQLRRPEAIADAAVDPRPEAAAVTRVYDLAPVTRAMATTRPAVSAGVFQDDVVAAIVDRVRPETWLANGGDVASIECWAGRLVVTQTPGAQNEVVAALRAMAAGGRR